jgi:flagellar biosynthesis protein FlhG
MNDQAFQLRQLLKSQSASQPVQFVNSPKSPRYVMVSSGKGGVGKSVISLNLALALTAQNLKVCLIDAQPGLGHIDLLAGQSGYWNLSHVIAGSRQLEQVLLKLDSGLTILPAASELHELLSSQHSLKDVRLQPEVKQIFEKLDQRYDVLLFDLGSGHLASSQKLALLAHDVLIVTTTETTALADTYSLLKHWRISPQTQLQLVINQSELSTANIAMTSLSQTLHTFLKQELNMLGVIPQDEALKASVAARKPLLMANPQSTASRAIMKLAQDLTHNWTPLNYERINWKTLSKVG